MFHAESVEKFVKVHVRDLINGTSIISFALPRFGPLLCGQVCDFFLFLKVRPAFRVQMRLTVFRIMF